MESFRFASGKWLDGYRFWTLQTAVWLGYGFKEWSESIEYLQSSGLPIDSAEAAIKAGIPAGLAFAVTSVFYLLSRQLHRRDEHVVLAIALAYCAAGAIAMALGQYALKSWLGYLDNWSIWQWQRWLGYAPSRFIVLALWFAAYLALRFADAATHQRERTKTLEAAANAARTEMLRYQVNPHLLFNALNTISSYLLDRDFERADYAIRKLSELMRLSLEDHEVERLSLGQEIDRVQLYLELEKIRFENRLTVSITLSESARRFLVPPMILQPLIENAMKHGIARSVQGGTIEINGELSDDALILTIRNTLPSDRHMISEPAPSEGFGVGLRNVSERIRMAYGSKAMLQISREQESQAHLVSLTLPVLAED